MHPSGFHALTSDDAVSNVSATSECTAHPYSFVSGRRALRIALNGDDSLRVNSSIVFTTVSISSYLKFAQEGD